jgi:iron complex outermembrane receptor protein
MQIRTILKTTGLLAPFLASAAHAQEPSSGDTADGEPASATTLHEIVVTAQKREQSLQDVPISVSALGDADLVANRVTSIFDLDNLVPNLGIRIVAGGVSLPAIAMRGVLSLGGNPGADKQVGLYLDGVSLYSAAGSVFDVADIERIEVLRGPQGTLFGRNATAGAIAIFTRSPTGTFDLRQELTLGNFDQFRSRTRLNLPALGPFTASASYVHSERRGDIRNLGAGTVWDYRSAPQSAFGLERSPKWLGDQNVDAVNAAIEFAPSDALTATYRFDWVSNHGSPEGSGVIALFPPGAGPAAGPLLAAILATQPTGASLTPITSRRPDAVNNWFSTRSELRNYGHNLTAHYRVSDALSLTNILAYRHSYTQSAAQLDGYGGLVSTIPPRPGFPIPLGSPFLIYTSVTASESKQWSDEFQLNYDSRLVTLTAGYLHFYGKTSQGGPSGLPNGHAFKFYPNFVLTPTADQPSVSKSTADAVFAQGEFHLVPRFDVVAGYRHTWDRKIGVAQYPGLPTRTEYDRDEPSWTVGLNYQPDREILLYGKYSAAFVAGGAISGLSYDPEHAKSWEAGLKADWLDHRLRTNLAIFTVKYTDLQQPASGAALALRNGRPELAQVTSFLINAGSARAKGFEFESSAVPFAGMTLQGGLGYTDTRFLSVNPIVGNIETYGVILRPKWTVNLAGQYQTPPLFDDARLTLRIDAVYHSRYDISTNDPTPALAAIAFSPSAWRVGGRLALGGMVLGSRSAELALWGRNIFDDKSIGFGTSFPFDYAVNYERARTYGLDLTIGF